MRALITGITGQDGQYLKTLLLGQGYHVFALVRQTNIRVDDVEVIYGDITAPPPLPVVDEIYNLAAMSHVGESFKIPGWTWAVNAVGAMRMIAHAKQTKAKFYQASTSELFGLAPSPQSIDTPMRPESPYGRSKLVPHNEVARMRGQGLYACAGILFNHESPLRGDNFVTKKICNAAKAIKAGKQTELRLGNIDVYRDWGHAKDYVRAMWQMMQRENPEDFVIATGISRPLQDWLETSFSLLDLDWREHVVFDSKLIRPVDVSRVEGRCNADFWSPTYSFQDIVREMTQ